MNHTALSEWQNFYVIVGSSAGALIGLQFVVMALVANMPNMAAQAEAGQAFMTPTIVHFGATLLLAGMMSAPWHGIAPVGFLWGLFGLTGVLYASIVTWRMRKQTAYQPEFEDWLFHAVLPTAAYALLIAARIEVSHLRAALFGVAAATLLLLFVGIHNAWDTVTYDVFVRKRKDTSP